SALRPRSLSDLHRRRVQAVPALAVLDGGHRQLPRTGLSVLPIRARAMGLLVRRLSVALVAVCCAASCAGPRPASDAYAVAARGACGDAQLVRKELIAM